MAKAKEYQQALNLRVEALCSVGIFSGTKYACTIKGIDCGKCRRPFDELDEAGMQLVRNLIAMPYPEGV